MTSTDANSTSLQAEAHAQSTTEIARPLANFPPSIWGDQFLSFSLDNSKLEAYGKAMEEPKEELRKLILNPTIDSNEKLSLIYSVYRLGLTYLFSKDIDDQLDNFSTSLTCKIIMKQISIQYLFTFKSLETLVTGFLVTCGYADVFNKFKDFSSGEFKEDITRDVRGMMSFYESAQLRTRGESILDEAIAFTETKLKNLENTLQGTLARQVNHALERPFHRGHPMVEARRYLLHFEEEISRYESLLTLAKVHFNYLQLLQKQELQIVSRWWKDLELQVKTSYVRDRVPECYVWILALFLEPCYSQARIITTKIILLVLVLDDTYDAYATIEEIRLLTRAINRWDVSAMSQLPEYIKPFYEIILNEYAELNKQGLTNLTEASKNAFQEQARGYLQEAEWRHSGEVPLFEEYMRIGLATSTHDLLCKSALIGMGKIVTQEAFAWYQSHPKIMIASQSISRLQDDVMTVEFERERAQSATSIDAYMKTYGVSETVAVDAIRKMVEYAWKDINEGCLRPTGVPMDLLAPIVNLAHMIDVAYKDNDGFTFPEKTLKECITLLLCVSVPM